MMADHLLDVYNRAPLGFERGEGAWLFERTAAPCAAMRSLSSLAA